MNWLLKWIYCPRLSLTYFCLGIPCGIFLGYLFFYTRPTSVACLVIQRSKSIDNINALKSTWLGKCDSYIIVKYNRTRRREAEKVESLDVINISSGSAWGSLCQALHLTPRSAKWLLVVRDTSMVFMENLKKYVEGRDYNELMYAGHPVLSYQGPYNVLSAGILLSRGILDKLWGRFPSKESCETEGKFWNNEDVMLGVIIGKLGAKVSDTRDTQGRGRFHGFNINTLLNAGPIFRRLDYFKKSLYPLKAGFECCSDEIISIDGTDADHATWQYFLAYKFSNNLRVKDVRESGDGVPTWVSALRDIGYEGPVDNISSQQYYDIWMRHIPPEKIAAQLAAIASS